jgi:hypothetical protein
MQGTFPSAINEREDKWDIVYVESQRMYLENIYCFQAQKYTAMESKISVISNIDYFLLYILWIRVLRVTEVLLHFSS